MNSVGAFRLAGWNHPFIGHAGARPRKRIRVAGDGGNAGVCHIKLGLVKVHANRLAVAQAVAEHNTEAFALVDPKHQRLNSVTLQTVGDGGLGAASAGLPVLGLLPLHPPQVLLPDEHAALRIVVQEAVEGDLNVDGNYPVLANWRGRKTPSKSCLGRGNGPKAEAR